MEYKYLKLPIITVEHFEEKEVLPKVNEEGFVLVTDGVTTQLWTLYTRLENLENYGTIKWHGDIYRVKNCNIFNEPPIPNPKSLLSGDTTIVPKGGYVSEESLIEIIKRITK